MTFPFWIAQATPGIDVSKEELLEAAVVIAHGTYGAFRYGDLCDLTVAEFEFVKRKLNELAKELENGK